MKNGFDIRDALVAIGLATSVALWAMLWAHPYPHPDLWPFLATFGVRIPLGALAILGKLALGAFAGIVYLIIRRAWIRFRDKFDELPDDFFFTRFCPLCGAAVFALSPFAWRSAQYLSPDFTLVLLSSFAVLLWQCGCGFSHVTLYLLSYVLLAFVAALNPLGLVVLVYVVTCDILRRWQSEQLHGQREDDADARRRRSIERILSIVGGMFGFGAGVYVGAAYFGGGSLPDGVISIILVWCRGWFQSAFGVIRSVNVLALAVGIGFAAAALALGRRLRAGGPRLFSIEVSLSSVLALLTVAFVLRAVDSPERVCLALIRDYIRCVLSDSAGSDWVFTDGRFDDAISFEASRRGMSYRILNALTPPSRAKSDELRKLAPESGERDVFAEGGAEVFRAWARERPDRLAKAAWQLGTSVVRRFDKVKPRTCGSVMRTVDGVAREDADSADRRFLQLTRELLGVVGRPSAGFSIIGGVDDAVSQRFDALVWRAARMASERSEAAAKAGQTNVAQTERVTMQTLDAANESLRAQSAALERLLPTASLVLTSKEALEVSLKRADFALAERYAREVMVSSPDDARAHFALGMASLEAGEFFNASRHFERILRTQPNEPTTLNNLALAYMKLGKLSEARKTIEKALESNPNSREIKKNLAAIQAAQKE